MKPEGLKKLPHMRVKQEEMHSHLGWNTSKVSDISSCLGRQVHEAVRISRTEPEIILNSKSEFHQAPIVRVVVTSGLQEEQTSAALQGVGAGGAGRSQGARRGRRGRGRARGMSRGG